MLTPGRQYSATSSYRYGFNGKENDNEVKGEGDQQDYGMRIYDPRLGRFLSVDPLSINFPWYTPYQFAGNKPIWATDLDGLEEKPTTKSGYEGQSEKTTKEITNSRGDWVSTKTTTWYYHKGGAQIGRKWNKEKQAFDPILSKGGWYTKEDYLDLLSQTYAAQELAWSYSVFAIPIDPSASRNELLKFAGENGSQNAQNFLVTAAYNLANKAQAKASGFTEPSSFNVEDIIGLGLILKEGLKVLGSYTTKQVLKEESKQLLLESSKTIHQHHVLSQKFRTWFKNRGISNIDDYTVEISAQTHLKGVHGKGLGNLPGKWNEKWQQYIFSHPNATPSEIFKQAEDMLKEFGLEHLRYVKYGK